MTALLLLIWWLAGSSDPAIGHPWSGWFVALFVCALLDMGRS